MPATFTVKAVTAKWTSKSTREARTAKTVHYIEASEPTTPYRAERATGVPVIGSQLPGTTVEDDGKIPCVEAFEEEAAAITKNLRFDDQNIRDGRGDDLHGVSSTSLLRYCPYPVFFSSSALFCNT